MPIVRALGVLLLSAAAAGAQPAPNRYPQPVRAGDLAGRQVLRPVEAQDVLGRVSGLVRKGGAVLLVVQVGGVLGFGTRSVAVPIGAAALLGEHVALLGLTPQQLAAQPTFDAAGSAPIPPDQTIQVALTRPFH